MAYLDNLSTKSLEEAGITWEELIAIQEDFKNKYSGYEQAAQAITNVMLKTPSVHSVRYRVKDSTHLMEKIVRKRLLDRERNIIVDNYEQEVTDLAGIRVLHLFKSDWRRIHKFITETWALHEQPVAYYREGDSAEVLGMFTKQDCSVKQHPAGYRSVHYIVKTSLTKAQRLVEIQVRTIFEEGWSEVDHKLRYPNSSDNPLTNELLLMLNRLAGSADEMSSFVQGLRLYLRQNESAQDKLKQERDELTAKLGEVMKNPAITIHDKLNLESVAKSINKSFLDSKDISLRFKKILNNLPSAANVDVEVPPLNFPPFDIMRNASDITPSKSADEPSTDQPHN